MTIKCKVKSIEPLAGRFEMAGAARDMFTQNKEAKRDHMYADAYAFI